MSGSGREGSAGEKRGVRVVPSYIRIGSMTTIPSTMKTAASTNADP